MFAPSDSISLSAGDSDGNEQLHMAREQCECGELDYEFHIQRVASERRPYCNCWRCGRDWTTIELVADLSDAVSADEVLDVHAPLEGDQSLEELMR